MSKKIKVTYVVNDFLFGGMQRQFIEQAKLFDNSCFDITLVTLFEFVGKISLYHELPKDMKVYRLNFIGFFDIRCWWELYTLLKRIQPDIVVSSLFFSNTLARLLKPLVGYVSVAREHNTYYGKKWHHKCIDRVLSGLTYRIVAVSHTVADFTATQEHIRRDKFLVICNGINIEHARDQVNALPSKEGLRQALRLPSDTFLFVNAVRLTSQKNIPLLIEGFAKCLAENKKVALVIVGDGPERKKLEKLARAKNVHERVFFCGYQPDVFPFYKAADCFISTSDMEGMSNAMLEALAAGLPVLSTKTAGTDEVLFEGKNGYYITNSSPAGVHASMRKILLSEWDRLSDGALNSARNFDIKTTVSAYEELFKEALSH